MSPSATPAAGPPAPPEATRPLSSMPAGQAVADGGVRFLLDGRAVHLPALPADRTVLDVLREELRCTSVKEGCAEGDCGACTIAVAERCGEGLALRAVNACIRFLPTLDGKAVFTAAGLADRTTGRLHAVQQALVDCHASQCGFCTPGFVMSLWVLAANTPPGSAPDEDTLQNALAGNLCRCTGYRPILEAARRVFADPARAAWDAEGTALALAAIDRPGSLAVADPAGPAGQTARFHAPRRLDELLQLRATYPEALLLAGGTDIGLWATKQLRRLPALICLTEVEELGVISRDAERLRLGAAVRLSQAAAELESAFPGGRDFWQRFAALPVRNAATLGGNLANGSPIGDSMPALIALGATLELASLSGHRHLPLEDFYLGYRRTDLRPGEVVSAVDIPLPRPGRDLIFRAYKLAKRYDSDISAVCCALALELCEGQVVGARLAFGGVAATPIRARQAERQLIGGPWTEARARAAMAALPADFTPLTDLRATADYRRQVAANLLYRFWLETRPGPLALAAAAVDVHAHAREYARQAGARPEGR